ncbi:unnamed protein product, partial [Timema podura]|nr:unnamed protein product [Timema podura]
IFLVGISPPLPRSTNQSRALRSPVPSPPCYSFLIHPINMPTASLSCEPLILLNTLHEIAIQAAIGGKIIARETVKPFRKDVTAKLYGGDVTRKMKLLKQQSEGKKKMRMVANIALPRETFIDILKR